MPTTLTLTLFLPACPTIDDSTIQIVLHEDHAMITWQITGTVTRVDILTCDADRKESPCVNTTENEPHNVPVIVAIPEGASLYRFDLFLYDHNDMVTAFENQPWLIVGNTLGNFI